MKFKNTIRQFAEERNWDQFHTPKNLSMALAAEAGELLEIFQWLTADQSEKLSLDQQIECMDEIADIVIYLIRLCDKLNFDLDYLIERKLRINKEKYPIELSKNNATKYNRR